MLKTTCPNCKQPTIGMLQKTGIGFKWFSGSKCRNCQASLYREASLIMIAWIIISGMAVPIGLFLLLFEPASIHLLLRLIFIVLLILSALFTDNYLAVIKVKKEEEDE